MPDASKRLTFRAASASRGAVGRLLLVEASIFASFDKNAYEAGDVLSVRLVVDNSLSQANLPAASFKLYQIVQLFASNEQHAQSVVISKAQGHPVGKGMKDERSIQVPLSIDAQPTCKGTLVRCQYFLEILQKVPGAASDLTIKQEIHVFQSTLPEYKPLETPDDWHPTNFPTVPVTRNYEQY
jgi:hypothetical protein